MTSIKLCSTEGDSFEVDLAVAKMSMTLKTMLEDLGYEDCETEVIQVPKVNSRIMRLVVDWAKHHVNDKPRDEVYEEEYHRVELPQKSDDIEEWDREFLKPLDTCDLFELIMASNYLHIKGLLEVASKAVANMIKGKSPSQIREVFNLPPRGRASVAVDDDDESDSD